MDYKTIFDVAVLALTSYTAYTNMKMRIEIDRLKWWIVRNFQPRSGAKFLDENIGD